MLQEGTLSFTLQDDWNNQPIELNATRTVAKD